MRKKPAKKQWFIPNIRRILIFFTLFFLLLFSLCSAGYVIFFRTVFAQEIMPVLKNSIVFEEPDPPVGEDISLLIEEVVEPPVSVEAEVIAAEPQLPKVAVIIDDIGYQYEIGKQLLEMPFELTFSFLPFAPYTQKLQETAYNLGKTIFLHLPLQPQSDEFDPGPGALLLTDSTELQKEKLDRCLEQVPYAVGVNNHMGSLYTEDTDAMDGVMTTLASKSLYFIDSYTTSSSIAIESAQRYGIKNARRNVFLDNEISQDHICGQLDKLINIAKDGGVAIGIAHPHRVTLEALKTCAPGYKSEVQYVSVLDLL
ncbi:divergent polysaccharide deacetylase family protein [Desulforhopalus sp. 52FAK]